MQEKLDQLYKTLQTLVKYHRELLDLVRLEKVALEEANLKGVQEITYKKEVLLNTIYQTETQRITDTAELAVSFKNPKKAQTLSEIIKEIEADYPGVSKQYVSSFNALSVMIKRISEQNKENQFLVDHCLEHVGKMKNNVIGEKKQYSSTYTAKGVKSQPGQSGSRFVTKEA